MADPFSFEDARGAVDKQEAQRKPFSFEDAQRATAPKESSSPAMETLQDVGAQLKAGAIEDAKAIGKVYPAAEAALNILTQPQAFGAYLTAGLGALTAKALGYDVDPQQIASKASEAATYKPMSEQGKALGEAAMLPVNAWNKDVAEGAGHKVADATGSAAAGAVTEATLQMLPSAFGARRGAKAEVKGKPGEAPKETPPAAAPAAAPAVGEPQAPKPLAVVAQVKRVSNEVKGTVDGFVDGMRRIFAPANVDPASKEAAGIIRARTGQTRMQTERAWESLKGFEKALDRLPESEQLEVMFRADEGGRQATPELQKAADAINAVLTDRRQKVQGLGKGHLSNFLEHYFPRVWERPVGNPAARLARILGKRPLEGSKDFLKARTIPTMREGMQWRTVNDDGVAFFAKHEDALADAKKRGAEVKEPLKPMTTNPVRMAMLRVREMDRFVMAHDLFSELKKSGLAKFVPWDKRASTGWVEINDKIARVFGPRDIPIHEGFDKLMMQQLEAFAKDIGVPHERLLSMAKHGFGEGTWGLASRAGWIASKFGGPESVITHELGHQLDYKYGLADKFVNDPKLKKELQALADLRFEGTPKESVPKAYKDYVRKGTEKIANLVHAFVHMPERMKEVAPNTYERFSKFVDDHPELKRLKEIKPSLVLGTGTRVVQAPGIPLVGQFFAPEGAARVINNYLSPGLRGNVLFDAARGLGNYMNALQLGMSAFHVAFTTMDVMISTMGLGVKQILDGKPIRGLANVVLGATPGLNVGTALHNIYRGDKVLKGYLDASSKHATDLVNIVHSLAEAGGAVRQDSFYRLSALANFRTALRGGKYGKAVLTSIPALIDAINHPIMEWLVPRQKAGTFAMLMQYEIEKNPNMSPRQLRETAGRVWNSVDNRLGQVVYDNLFWNRTLKDLGMVSVRSLGWNLGDIREIPGGLLDLKDALRKGGEVSHRLAYVAALPVVVGIYGALTQYLATGKGPEELKDYFAPKNGRTRPDGTPDRSVLASYMRDVLGVQHDSWQMAKNKINPALSSVVQFLNNEDYYGALIRNPDDPWVQQLQDDFKFVAKQFVPYSITGAQRLQKEGAGPAMAAGAFFGITPAPAYLTRDPEEQAALDRLHRRRALAAKLKEEGREDEIETMDEDVKEIMSQLRSEK